MEVSVIICTYSLLRYDELLDAVASLQVQTYRPSEIIVVVDHNPALYQKLASALSKEVYLVHNQKVKGLSGSRNYGIDAAHGDIIAFLDDDAVAAENWITELVKPYHEDNTVAVGGLTLPQWERKKPAWFPAEFYWVLGCTYQGHAEQTTVVRNVFGGNCSFRSSCLERAGKFLPNIGRIGDKMLTGEETEYCMRIWQLMPDKKIIFTPSAVIYHKIPVQRTRLKYFIQRTYGSGFSMAIIHSMLPQHGIKTEQNFLRHLLFKFLPRMFSNLFRTPFHAGSQLAVVVLGVFTTGCGFIAGLISKRMKGIKTDDDFHIEKEIV